MKTNDFLYLCREHNIKPTTALEDKFVCKILKQDKAKSSITNQILLSTYLKTKT